MEAAIRTAYELYTGQTLVDIEVEAVRGLAGIKEGRIMMDGQEIRVAVAHGLGNACRLLDAARQDPSRYHFIEIMAPGGCIGGGGQPYAGANTIPWTTRPCKSGPRPSTTWTGQDHPAEPRQSGRAEAVQGVLAAAAQSSLSQVPAHPLQGQRAARDHPAERTCTSELTMTIATSDRHRNSRTSSPEPGEMPIRTPT